MLDKYSIRIGGRVTSFNLPKPFVALYVALTVSDPKIDPRDYMLSQIDIMVDGWVGLDGKGLGEFIITRMCENLLDEDDISTFQRILTNAS